MTIIDELEAERMYRAIGRFMFEFSQMEFSIRVGVADEVHIDERFFDPLMHGYDMNVRVGWPSVCPKLRGRRTVSGTRGGLK
jgi:hypothetical protein